MDDKTLEYMGERVDKSRKIIKKISVLVDQSKRIVGSEKILFKDRYGNLFTELNSTSPKEQVDSPGMIREINTLVVKAINQEIARLEQELAEL
ncbi:hypothetical protein EJP82_01080 [Paenibacillus anaericanus]|uniref:Uncharacterized protein n=1 Tax=Paenibacillus anaericanus TaxID=170367 RepID=A0A433YFC2_9BACL|nr:hypothetical protein [Paenibacillus anaericanus]RUT48566.1 hypothetical protein EJP82_01080 [Paenibacillus anaericanus]